MTTAQTGALGESAAVDYLRQRGYEICSRNWRSGHYELDIVARKWDEMHFVEVKTRQMGAMTLPEQALDRRKQRAFALAVKAYLDQHPWMGEVRMDLVAVEMDDEGRMEVRMIEDAVEAHW